MARSGRRTSQDERCSVKAHTAGLVAVTFSMCGQRLATGGDDLSVILWDLQTGEAEHVLHGHTERVSSISFSADGARLASGSWDGSIRIWDAATGAVLRTIQEDESLVTWVHFSPSNSRRLASAGYGIFVRQWDVDSGALVRCVRGYSFATFSADGRTIATGSAENEGPADVHLVDAETGAVRLRIGHPANVFSVSFSADGSKLASGCFVDGACMVWDSSTGALLHTIGSGKWTCSVSWGRDWLLEKQRQDPHQQWDVNYIQVLEKVDFP